MPRFRSVQQFVSNREDMTLKIDFDSTAAGVRFIVATYANDAKLLGPQKRFTVMVIFTPLSDEMCTRMDAQQGSVLVTWFNRSRLSYPFAPHGYLSDDYVAEKLGASDASEAFVLTKLIGKVLKRPTSHDN